MDILVSCYTTGVRQTTTTRIYSRGWFLVMAHADVSLHTTYTARRVIDLRRRIGPAYVIHKAGHERVCDIKCPGIVRLLWNTQDLLANQKWFMTRMIMEIFSTIRTACVLIAQMTLITLYLLIRNFRKCYCTLKFIRKPRMTRLHQAISNYDHTSTQLSIKYISPPWEYVSIGYLFLSLVLARRWNKQVPSSEL